MMKEYTYGDLFEYLQGMNWSRSTGLELCSRFLRLNHAPEKQVLDILQGFGGYCDGEVVFNVIGRIDPSTLLSEPVETPAQYAERHGLYLEPDEYGWSALDLNAAMKQMMEVQYG